MRYKHSSMWYKSPWPSIPFPFLNVTLFLLSFIFHLNFTLFLSNAYWASLVAHLVKSPPTTVGDAGSIPGWEGHLEKEMATHSSVLTWKIPWTKEPGGLQSMGSQRVGRPEQAHIRCRIKTNEGERSCLSFLLLTPPLITGPCLLGAGKGGFWSITFPT